MAIRPEPTRRGGRGGAHALLRAALALIALASVAAGSAVAAGAEDAAPARASWAYDLAGELMSPFCPGRTVASCPSPQATELIQWIAMQEAAGASREEVVAMLVEKHGEAILGAPPARGITLWAYVFPVAGFLAFGGVAVLVLRRIVAPRTDSVPGVAPRPAAEAVPPPAPGGASGRPDGRGAEADELARIVDAELAERA